MITLKQPKTIATEQKFVFEELHMAHFNGQLSATVVYAVSNETGERIDTVKLTYTGEEFNAWWEDFSSGKFLYEELVRIQELGVSVPEAVEEQFINKIEE